MEDNMKVLSYNGDNPVIWLAPDAKASSYLVLDPDGHEIDRGQLAPHDELLLEVAPGSQITMEYSDGGYITLNTAGKRNEEIRTAATRRMPGIRVGV